jgi:hypothetical protein
VQTLIAVSTALQRERTALKPMLQLLVDRLDDLELGQIIPVGDLFDVIADGNEPFSEARRIHFDNAKRLCKQKLLRCLERHSGGRARFHCSQAHPVRQQRPRVDGCQGGKAVSARSLP